MHILILSQWYIPEPVLLLQELAQTLIARGHTVEVLTGFPNYPSGELYAGYKIRLYQRETIAGVPVVRVPLYPEHSRSGIKRALNYLSFAISSSLLGPFLLSKPDVIFVYHPPLTVGIPAWILSRLWHIPFLYQVQDMWPETLKATGMLNSRHGLDWIEKFAKWVYARAAAICVISPGFHNNLVEKGVSSNKIHFIPNWVDTDAYYPAHPDFQLAQTLGLSDKFNVMFAGNVGEAQHLETILDAAKILRNAPDVQFVIVGDGVALSRLQEYAKEHELNNVKFLGRHPAESMPALYALADVLLVHLKDDPLFRITIPHKILAYMASGRPILAAVAGDAANVITEAGAGISCHPQDSEALASTVNRFLDMSVKERQTMGERGLAAVHQHYSQGALVAQIEALLESLVSGQ